MKKITALFLALLFLFSLSVPAMAALSPSRKKISGQFFMLTSARTSVQVNNLLVTAYEDKNNVQSTDPEIKEEALLYLNDAYDSSDKALTLAARRLGVQKKDMAVSQIFAITAKDSTDTEVAGATYMVKLSDAEVKNFAALLGKTPNGDWKMITDAKVQDGVLSFTTDVPMSFAILTKVNPDEWEVISPVTGRETPSMGVFALLTLCGGALLLKKRK